MVGTVNSGLTQTYCSDCPNHNACRDMGGCLKEIRKAIKPGHNSILNAVAYEVYVGWMSYYKGRNGRDEKTLLERLRKVKQILEDADMWPPRVEP